METSAAHDACQPLMHGIHLKHANHCCMAYVLTQGFGIYDYACHIVTCDHTYVDTHLKMRIRTPTPTVVMRVRYVATLVAYDATLGLPAPSSFATLEKENSQCRWVQTTVSAPAQIATVVGGKSTADN